MAEKKPPRKGEQIVDLYFPDHKIVPINMEK